MTFNGHFSPSDLWGDESPAVCAPTLAFARHAAGPWSPPQHRLYHARFREVIQLVLLVSIRLMNAGGDDDGGEAEHRAADSGGPAVLPRELWLWLCSFLLRGDWAVTPQV